MALLKNGKIVTDVINDLGIMPGTSPVPNQSADFIQPTYDYNNALFCDTIASTGLVTATSTTVFTTPTDKDFFLSSFVVAGSQPSNSTNTNFALNVTVNGKAQSWLVPMLVGGNDFSTPFQLNLRPALKLDRNTTITATMSNNTHSEVMSATITGFTKNKL